jgi:peptidoglycan hydrolase CwlO-like protein
VVVQRVGLGLLTVVLLMEVGCVSRSTYERVRAEAQENTRALEAVREDVKGLDEQIARLQAANRREDATTAELRATIQQEEEQLPIMRQRAENMLASLKTEVANLMNQSWHLARKIADIRHESASLQHMAAQYKQEIETARAPVMVASDADQPTITQPVVAEASELSAAPMQETTPPQITESTLATPSVTSAAPSVPSPSVNIEPPATSDSWIGMIIGWLTTFWNWLFS